ncbi:DUF6515 family protein [Gallaecimonas sp. GXIMD4217]|uniref:DUF6515 family protein n=1 Tax=Gallaecimonas sp. GXIMD4217 TaxID=3131927 RepID=UPI00311AD3CA
MPKTRCLICLLPLSLALSGGAWGHDHHDNHRKAQVVKVLPKKGVKISFRGSPYFFANGVFYRKGSGGYMVVTAPVGIRVTTLPAHARRLSHYPYPVYVVGSTYYRWHADARIYEVIAPPDAELQPGQQLNRLPEGATSFMEDGVLYFRYRGHRLLPVKNGKDTRYVVLVP